jgi:hypothetical protein
MFVFRYKSPQHFLDVFRTYYGPMHKAFGALDNDAAAAFARDLLDLAETHNTVSDRSLRVPSEYLEVVATKRS